MKLDQVRLHLNAYKENDQILDAAYYLIHSFNLEHENFAGFDFRPEIEKHSILLTAEGEIGEKQIVRIPKNLFDFDISLVANMIAHEMLHVRQKSPEFRIEEKNEREFQAYYEMLFHLVFPQIPDAPDFNRIQFAEKALEYYKRMGENSELQKKYAHQKIQVEAFLQKLAPTPEDKSV